MAAQVASLEATVGAVNARVAQLCAANAALAAERDQLRAAAKAAAPAPAPAPAPAGPEAPVVAQLRDLRAAAGQMAAELAALERDRNRMRAQLEAAKASAGAGEAPAAQQQQQRGGGGGGSARAAEHVLKEVSQRPPREPAEGCRQQKEPIAN